jgi:hypothetical protein
MLNAKQYACCALSAQKGHTNKMEALLWRGRQRRRCTAAVARTTPKTSRGSRKRGRPLAPRPPAVIHRATCLAASRCHTLATRHRRWTWARGRLPTHTASASPDGRPALIGWRRGCQAGRSAGQARGRLTRSGIPHESRPCRGSQFRRSHCTRPDAGGQRRPLLN